MCIGLLEVETKGAGSENRFKGPMWHCVGLKFVSMGDVMLSEVRVTNLDPRGGLKAVFYTPS